MHILSKIDVTPNAFEPYRDNFTYLVSSVSTNSWIKRIS